MSTRETKILQILLINGQSISGFDSDLSNRVEKALKGYKSIRPNAAQLRMLNTALLRIKHQPEIDERMGEIVADMSSPQYSMLICEMQKVDNIYNNMIALNTSVVIERLKRGRIEDVKEALRKLEK